MADPLPASDSVALSHVLRPRSIGDILDATIRLYRRYFLLYFSIVMIVQAVVFVVSQGFNVPYHFLTQRFLEGANEQAFESPEALLELATLGIPAGIGLVLLLVVAIVGYQFSTGGLVTAVSDTFLGRAITVGDAYRTVVARFWSLFGAGLLSSLLQFAVVMVGGVAFMLSLVLGALLGGGVVMVLTGFAGFGVLLVSILGAFYVLLVFLLAPQVVMLEDNGAVDALRRSWQLMRVRSERGVLRNNVFRAGVILMLVFIINAAVSFVLVFPFWIAYFAFIILGSEGGLEQQMGMVPLWVQIPIQLIQTVGSAAVMPLGMIAMILLYYDIRIRFEGFDLQVRASEL